MVSCLSCCSHLIIYWHHEIRTLLPATIGTQLVSNDTSHGQRGKICHDSFNMNFANLVLTQFWMSFCFCIQMNPWQSHSDENANIEKYIKDQFFENCFGSDTMKLMGDREAHARSYCSKEILKTTPRPSSTSTSSTRPTTATSTTTTLRTTTATKRTTTRWSWMSPSLQGLQYPVFPSLPLINQLQYYPSPLQNQVLGAARPRGQKSLSVSVTSKVDELKSKLNLKIKEMNCFLTKLGVVDTEGLITRETLLKEFKDSIEDLLLRKDLSDGVIKCEEKSKCLGGMRASDRSHLSQALDFYKCYEEAKTEACVRKNIRSKVTQQLR